jgi:dinuclear metal center YbgI/SA1388 family protein|uniref:GTP cyclohydrolase 1 type 2 homolog n=1 Tax=Desulfobacca acetoxidans TaxID=60893 RepID=A0A7C5AKS0_9BACT
MSGDSVMPTVKEVLDCLADAYPWAWAVPGDRVGLQTGEPSAPVKKVMVALEVSLPVVAEAQALGAQMLLTHHPLFYQPAVDLREDKVQGRLLAAVVRAGLAVAACHTNLDLAPRGLNEFLAAKLELTEVEVLESVRVDPWLKLAVFVPVGYEDPVREALMDERVGVIGRYSHCSFAARGQGTFRPVEGARPFRGKVAELCRAAESRLEVLLPESRVARVLARLRAVHPYEEVAYDLYPLANPGHPLGFGRVGRWPGGKSWEEVLTRVKEIFGVNWVRVWGRPPATVERVAVLGGSGGDLIFKAWEAEASLLVTGEVRHHQAVPFPEGEFAILEVGHFASEVVYMPVWAQEVSRLCRERGITVEVIPAAREISPFHIY